MTNIASLADLGHWLGKEFPPSPWVTVTQGEVQKFAEATGDHQWIHLDEERAARESPFGGTIAHGFLTLSLLSALMQQMIAIGGVKMGVNYGLNRVRFMSPVRAGCAVRARFTLVEMTEVPGGRQLIWNSVIEQQGESKPCCVAEWVVRRFD
ncbi:MAG: MaoC family dehydratase [Cupriavidus necator]